MVSHQFLVKALMASHAHRACLFVAVPDRAAAMCSASIRMLLSKFRDVVKEQQVLQMVGSRAATKIPIYV